MGVIRKTASVGTLGLINFRSKKEKLHRTERKLAHVEAKLKKLRSSESTDTPVAHAIESVVTGGRKHGRRARRAARRASHEVRVGAEKVLDEARSRDFEQLIRRTDAVAA